MYDIEQNLIQKIVPMVVAIIKDTVAKRIFNSPGLTACSDICLVPAQAQSVRTAIDKFIRVSSESEVPFWENQKSGDKLTSQSHEEQNLAKADDAGANGGSKPT